MDMWNIVGFTWRDQNSFRYHVIVALWCFLQGLHFSNIIQITLGQRRKKYQWQQWVQFSFALIVRRSFFPMTYSKNISSYFIQKQKLIVHVVKIKILRPLMHFGSISIGITKLLSVRLRILLNQYLKVWRFMRRLLRLWMKIQ